MKTQIIIGSPKRRFSTSSYFASILKFFLWNKEVSITTLKTRRDYEKIISQLNETENLVFVFPIYVDAIPSTVLEYLRDLETRLPKLTNKIHIYSLQNCGFYEGRQCCLVHQQMKHWSLRSKMIWSGGLGIGAGEMLNFIRIMVPLGLLLMVVEIIIKLFSETGLQGYMPISFAIQAGIFVAFSLGMFLGIYRLANAIRKGEEIENRYTTVWFCPRFLFVILASIYWILRALICHGTVPMKLFRKIDSTFQNDE